MYTSPSNKKYIGQTINEKARRNAFFNLNHVYSEGGKLENARKKYNPINFKYEHLDVFESDNKIELLNKLNELEQYYILKFDSYKTGYNSTTGGISVFIYTDEIKNKISKSKTKVVLQYDMDGIFIKKWNSTKDIAIEFNCSPSTISKCCNNIAKKSLGYIWKYYEEEFPLILDTNFSNKDKLVSNSYINRNIINGNVEKPVLKYDLSGNYIEEYNSIQEAVKLNEKTNRSSLSGCCTGKFKTSGGFIWRYKLDDNYSLNINIDNITQRDLINSTLNKKGEKPIYQFDLNNNLIKRFNSFSEAVKELNICRTGIYQCCTGKLKTYKKYIWKYASE